MGTGQGDVPGDRILVHAHQAAGAPRTASFADVVQHVQGFRVGQSGLLQDGPFAFGEVSLAGSTVDHANAFALATPAPEDEITVTSLAPIGAIAILATEILDGMHGDPPGSQIAAGTPVVPLKPSVVRLRGLES